MSREASLIGLFLTILGASCTRHTREGIQGTWNGEFRVSRRDPQYRLALRLPPPSRDTATAIITLRFDSAPGSHCEGRCVVGVLRSLSDSALSPGPPGSAITGVQTAQDSVYLSIGSCCDSGALALSGRLKGHQIIGRWEQTFLGPGDGGTFLLTRESRSQ